MGLGGDGGSCREGFDESAVAPDDKGLKEREMIRKNGGGLRRIQVIRK